jgi:integrase
MGTWKTIKDADGKGGVRYREHPTRKHGAVPDRYYTIAYWWQGKTVSEGIGWASEKWTPTKCFDLLARLKNNQAIGKGPCTLAEMREQAEADKQARRKAQKAEAENDISFKKFFEETFLPDAKTRWKTETSRKAIEHVKNWINPVTGETSLREIRLTHVNRIKAKLSEAQKSPRMQQYVFRTFCMVWNHAVDHGLVKGPCPTKSQSFRLPKVDNEKQRYLTLDEEKKLLAEILKINRQAHDMALLALDAGLRFGEIAALAWGCIDIANGIIRVLDTKGGKDRFVPMTDRLKLMFESMERGNAGALIFPRSRFKTKEPKTKQGGIQTQVPSAFKRALNKAGLNEGIENRKMRASFHSLRHTYASRLVQAGVDLYRVQRLLGHSTPVMTARYSKLADSDLKKAVEKMEEKSRIQEEREKNAKVIHLRQIK